MATFRKGILGSFSGTVGPVVGATYRGQDVLRSRPRKSTKPATDLQMMQRRKFGKAVQFITPAKMIIADYFGSAAGDSKKHTRNFTENNAHSNPRREKFIARKMSIGLCF